MYPLIVAGVAAAAIVFTSRCREETQDPQTDFERTAAERASDNQSNRRATIEQASTLIQNSSPGNKIAVSYHCTSFSTGGRDAFPIGGQGHRFGPYSFDGSRNECEDQTMAFQNDVIERFEEHAIECSIRHYIHEHHMLHSAVCTVTKQ